MTTDKTATADNKTEETNEIRITLKAHSPVVTGGPDPEIAEITIQMPEKYRDFDITGVSHIKSGGISYEDVFGVDRPIVMNDWFQPVFGDWFRQSIYDDISDLLDISLTNQKQNQTMLKLIKNTMYRRAEKDRDESEKIHSADKPDCSSIKATISSK